MKKIFVISVALLLTGCVSLNESKPNSSYSNDILGISFEYPEKWNVVELNYKPSNENFTRLLRLANYYSEPVEYPSRTEGDIWIMIDYFETADSVEDFFTANDPFVGEGLEESIALVKWQTGKEVEEAVFEAALDTVTVNGRKFLTSIGQLPIHMDDGGPVLSKRYYFSEGDKIYMIHAQVSLATGEKKIVDAADKIIGSISFGNE